MNRIRATALILLLGGLPACNVESPPPPPATAADSQAAHIQAVVAAGGAVDSILPIAEHLRRFRLTVAERVDTLRCASRSIDALVERWATAVASSDTAALNSMVIDRAEFAWLYYPGSQLSEPPYEAPPELLWAQFLGNSDEGARRLLRRFGGRPIAVRAVSCPSVKSEGQNRLHEGCLVRLETDGSAGEPLRLFGTIMERDGRFKFVGYTNAL